jgi:hypothetical protein
MATEYDPRRPRIPVKLALRIDSVRGQVPFDRFVRETVEAALSGSPNGASPPPERVPEPGPAPSSAREAALPQASDDVRRREPDPRMFKTAGDHRRAMARFNAKGEW